MSESTHSSRSYDATALGEDGGALRRAQERADKTFHCCPWPISLGRIDDGVLLDANDAIARLLGYRREELIGHSAVALGIWVEPAERDRCVKHLLADGQLDNAEVHLRTRNGEVLLCRMSARLIELDGQRCSLTSVMDLSEQHRTTQQKMELQARLDQAQRLEAIGTLAGGIAHDFNNILGAIGGCLEVALSELPEDSPARPWLGEMDRAADRATALVRQILAFSRKGKLSRQSVDLVKTVQEVMRLIRAALPATIAIEEVYQSCPTIMADPGQLHQVVMNLCTNAGLAMAQEGGVLRVYVCDCDAIEGAASRPPELDAGRYVCLTVTDTGCGIAPEFLGRIFEPFFTTRAKDKGTGLGLSVVHGIVREYGGAIAVESQLGLGTSFKVWLPLCTVSVADAPSGNLSLQGKERVLFIDDEPTLTEIARRGLTSYGYDVATFSDPVAALAAFRASPSNFDVVISDLTMPGLTGDALVVEIRRLRPDLPIVLATGFCERLTPEQAKDAGADAFVDKPLVPSALACVIRQVCSARRAAG